MESVTLSRLLAVIAIGVWGCTSQINAKEYYKWVDARGVTTYSATPPPVQKQEPQLEPARHNAPTLDSAQSSKNQAIPPQAVKEPKPVVITTSQTTPKAVPATTATNPVLAPVTEILIPVKNCNGVRCWDSKGKHYSLVAGNTYLSANGGKCHKIGNNLHCNK